MYLLNGLQLVCYLLHNHLFLDLHFSLFDLEFLGRYLLQSAFRGSVGSGCLTHFLPHPQPFCCVFTSQLKDSHIYQLILIYFFLLVYIVNYLQVVAWLFIFLSPHGYGSYIIVYVKYVILYIVIPFYFIKFFYLCTF